MRYLILLIFASSLAHAKVCYQGRAQVLNLLNHRMTRVIFTLDWNGGRGELVNRVRVDGQGIRVTSTIFCGDFVHQRAECGLEEDGGRAVIQVFPQVATFAPIGRMQVEADDTGALNHLEIAPTANPQQPIVLRLISTALCARLFPQSDRIVVPPPPRY